MAKHVVYRLYAELRDYQPKIWRRFDINGEKTVAELIYSLMIMFEMQASHLFTLKLQNRTALLQALNADKSTDPLIKDVRFELSGDDLYVAKTERVMIADEVTLNQAIRGEHAKLTFRYDFGDDWWIDIAVKDIAKKDISLRTLPKIIDGAGFGIIENVGGVGGLTRLARVLQTRKAPDYQNSLEWLDSKGLDLAAFDKEDMNLRLKKLLSVYKGIYEFSKKPTEKAMNFFLRTYMDKGSRGY